MKFNEASDPETVLKNSARVAAPSAAHQEYVLYAKQGGPKTEKEIAEPVQWCSGNPSVRIDYPERDEQPTNSAAGTRTVTRGYEPPKTDPNAISHPFYPSVDGA